jgi:adenylate kinase family enzyme
MPLLEVDDPLPGRPSRVLVAGTSGSGKTTLAARIGVALAITHIEIDSLFHGPDWTERESFVADVHRFSAESGWVTEWQYGVVRQHLLERADLMIWLDLPRRTVIRQVTRRTLVRRLRRRELWNGNIEPPLWTIFTDSEHIIRWAWSAHARTGRRMRALPAQRPDLPIVRLRSRAEVERWCSGPLSAVTIRPDGGASSSPGPTLEPT